MEDKHLYRFKKDTLKDEKRFKWNISLSHFSEPLCIIVLESKYGNGTKLVLSSLVWYRRLWYLKTTLHFNHISSINGLDRCGHYDPAARYDHLTFQGWQSYGIECLRFVKLQWLGVVSLSCNGCVIVIWSKLIVVIPAVFVSHQRFLAANCSKKENDLISKCTLYCSRGCGSWANEA